MQKSQNSIQNRTELGRSRWRRTGKIQVQSPGPVHHPNCDVGSLHEERLKQAKIRDFLVGLNFEYYSCLPTQIISMDQLPSLDRAYQSVMQGEWVRLRSNPHNRKLSVFLCKHIRAAARVSNPPAQTAISWAMR